MARNRKQGLDHFPLDTDFFQDLRIRKLIKYQGGKAITVYTLLLCCIYKCGYFIRWDNELPFILSEQSGFGEAYIREVITCCLNIGLLDKAMFDAEKVLTSKGIQRRYQHMCQLSRRSCKITNHTLISSEKTYINAEETPIFSARIPISSEKMHINAEEMAINSEEINSDLNSLAEALKAQRGWCESICMSLRISPDELHELIDEFIVHCKLYAKTPPSLVEAQRHFVNWRYNSESRRREQELKESTIRQKYNEEYRTSSGASSDKTQRCAEFAAHIACKLQNGNQSEGTDTPEPLW